MDQEWCGEGDPSLSNKSSQEILQKNRNGEETAYYRLTRNAHYSASRARFRRPNPHTHAAWQAPERHTSCPHHAQPRAPRVMLLLIPEIHSVNRRLPHGSLSTARPRRSSPNCALPHGTSLPALPVPTHACPRYSAKEPGTRIQK